MFGFLVWLESSLKRFTAHPSSGRIGKPNPGLIDGRLADRTTDALAALTPSTVPIPRPLSCPIAVLLMRFRRVLDLRTEFYLLEQPAIAKAKGHALRRAPYAKVAQ